jgi:4-hydroxybenzoate polyprenyltransferase
MKQVMKQLFRLDHLIPALSLVYIGLLFASRSEYEIWILVTIAVISAKIAHKTFQKIMDNLKRNKSPRYREQLIIPLEIKKSILWFTGILSSALFISSSFFINELSYFFSIASVFLLVVFPFIKRYSSLPYYHFGFFEAICPVAGFIAANNRFEIIPFIISGAVFFWFAGLETSWGIFEIEYDIDKKIFSIPAKLGIIKTRVFSIIFYTISLSAFTTAGIITGRGLAYWISLICFIIIIFRQELLLTDKDMETARREFLQINNFIIPIIFIGTLIDIFYN